MSSSFPYNGVNRARHWMHDGRPRHHDSFSLDPCCSTIILGSQRVPRSESDAYHPVEATSQTIQDGLLAGAAWRAGRPEEVRSTSSGAYSDHTWPLTRREMSGQSLHDRRLQKVSDHQLPEGMHLVPLGNQYCPLLVLELCPVNWYRADNRIWGFSRKIVDNPQGNICQTRVLFIPWVRMVLHMLLLRRSPCREIFMILMFQGHSLKFQDLIFQLASHRFLIHQCHNSLLLYRDMGGVLL